MKKTRLGIVGAGLLALPFLLAGCGEGEAEGVSEEERNAERFTPETTKQAPGGAIGEPEAIEAPEGQEPPPPPEG